MCSHIRFYSFELRDLQVSISDKYGINSGGHEFSNILILMVYAGQNGDNVLTETDQGQGGHCKFKECHFVSKTRLKIKR